MDDFHEYATYFALVLGSISVAGISVYGTVRCFQREKYLVGVGVLALLPSWFQGNALLFIFLYAIASPDKAGTTAEYAVAPVYLAIAGITCYPVLRYARRLT